jgi:geranylgeranyl diphosphate synthase type II
MNFNSYKIRVEESLLAHIQKMGPDGRLRRACAYSLTSGGKRLRPILVLMTAEALGKCDAMPSALAVEFFHTASLIGDDLPCMDNDSFRRGIPSLHKEFEESTAILASYTLIAEGYGGIYENGRRLREDPLLVFSADARAMIALEWATRCAGIQGATQGQFLDLFPPNSEIETLREIIDKKTVTLFEISLVFGWVFGGGDLTCLPKVKKCAYHLGMAFQIADDLEDASQDASLGRGVNITDVIGRDHAISLFKEEIAHLEKSLRELHLWTPPFQEFFYQLASYRGLFTGSSLFQGTCSG